MFYTEIELGALIHCKRNPYHPQSCNVYSVCISKLVHLNCKSVSDLYWTSKYSHIFDNVYLICLHINVLQNWGYWVPLICINLIDRFLTHFDWLLICWLTLCTEAEQMLFLDRCPWRSRGHTSLQANCV